MRAGGRPRGRPAHRETSLNRERRAELYDRVEAATEWPMLLLAIVWVAVFVIPDVVEVPPDVSAVLEGIGWILWGIFVFETVAKTYIAPDRAAYLRSHWFELITILVPYLRPLRVLVVSLLLWEEARITIRHRTFSFIGLASVLVVSLSALAIYGAERGTDGSIQTPADALWWAMATITTVGYGDVYPKTPLGRAIAVFLMLAGISLFSLLTARIAAFFVKSEADRDDPNIEEILRRLRRLEQQNDEVRALLLVRAHGASSVGAPADPARAAEGRDAAGGLAIAPMEDAVLTSKPEVAAGRVLDRIGQAIEREGLVLEGLIESRREERGG